MLDSNQPSVPRRYPWNKGRLIGQKRPLKPKDVWSIRVRLQVERRARNLALFNLAIDSKLRGCDLVRLQVDDVSIGGRVRDRATIVQKKTGRPVQFEITEQTRAAIQAWLADIRSRNTRYLFPSRVRTQPHLSTRQYAAPSPIAVSNGWDLTRDDDCNRDDLQAQPARRLFGCLKKHGRARGLPQHGDARDR